MLKRIGIVFGCVFALALGIALQATPTSAQDETYYTYVSEWNVPRGQWAAFEKERDQGNAAMQRLVADGTIIAWGNDINLVHTEDGFTQEDFFMATSRAAILKALDALRPGATGGAYTAVTKHRDYFMHTLAHGGKTSSGATGILRVVSWQAKPHEGDALTEVVKKYIVPELNAQIADGSVVMFNFDTEEIHTDPQGLYFLAIIYSSGEAMDKAFGGLLTDLKANPAVGDAISSITVAEAHRDSLAKVTAFQHK
jgi:hypothetical protein